MGRLRAPCVTPVAALIMVQLMTLGDDRAQTTIIGRTVATITGRAWPFSRPYWEFFAGSTTLSNLTFIWRSGCRTLCCDPGRHVLRGRCDIGLLTDCMAVPLSPAVSALALDRVPYSSESRPGHSAVTGTMTRAPGACPADNARGVRGVSRQRSTCRRGQRSHLTCACHSSAFLRRPFRQAVNPATDHFVPYTDLLFVRSTRTLERIGIVESRGRGLQVEQDGRLDSLAQPACPDEAMGPMRTAGP